MKNTAAIVDKVFVRRSFSRAASTYQDAAVLQREISARMSERLALIKLQPQHVLDMGAGTGNDTEHLLSRYPKAKIIAMDFALPMLKYARKRGSWRRRPRAVCADMEHLPFADNSLDLVYSNLAMQWVNAPEQLFRECMRVIKPGGLLMFSTFGPDTLQELRAAFSSVDDRPHVSPFMDMHDVGDILVNSGFAEPVMDMDLLTLTYTEVDKLMTDLKAIGAHNASIGRRKGLTAPRRMQAMRVAYEKFRRQGLLPATYEVVYGHAWVSEQKPPRGETQISVDMINRS